MTRSPLPRFVVAATLLLAVAGAAALFGAAVPPSPAAAAIVHFELERSMPVADTVLTTAPDAIQLWFTEEPEAEGARIRLVADRGGVVATSRAEMVPDTTSSLRASIEGAMPDGPYTVQWRAMARDGHVVSGEIPFTVHAAQGR